MKTEQDCPIPERVKRCQLNLLGALPVNRDQISEWLLHPERYWRQVSLRKPSGDIRMCYCPVENLSRTQIKIMEFLRTEYLCRISHLATAFEPGNSIIRNAELHRHNRSSLVLDLRNAFASVSTKHVYSRLKRVPEISKDTAWVWSRLLTFRGCIRQGSRISPSLFNMMMENFDQTLATTLGASLWPSPCRHLSSLIGETPHVLSWYNPLLLKGLLTTVVYTRYGDDLCFSTPFEEFPAVIEEKIRQTVGSLRFRLNTKRKTGKNGMLRLPGIEVVQGRIQPTGDVIEEWASLGPCASQAVLRGYQSYFNQFRRSARRHVRDRKKELIEFATD